MFIFSRKYAITEEESVLLFIGKNRAFFVGKIVELLIIKNLYFIVLLPLLAGVVTIVLRNFGLKIFKGTALTLTGVSAFASLAFCTTALVHCLTNTRFLLENTFRWFNLGYSKISFDVGILIDRTSSFTGFLAACVCVGAFIYLIKKRSEFDDLASRCLLLDVIMFVLFSLLFNSNLLQAIVAGMLVSILIFIFTERQQGFEAAQRILTPCIALDLIFIFCAMMMIYHAYNFDITQGIGLLSFVNVDYWSLAIFGLSDNFVFSFFVMLFMITAMLKILSILILPYINEKSIMVLLFAVLFAFCIGTQFGIRLFPLYKLSSYPFWLIVLVFLFGAGLGRFGNISYKVIKKIDTFLEVFPEFVFAKGSGLISGSFPKKQEETAKFYFLYAAVTIVVLFIILALVYHRVMKM